MQCAVVGKSKSINYLESPQGLEIPPGTEGRGITSVLQISQMLIDKKYLINLI